MFDKWDEPVRVLIDGITHLVFDETKAAEMLLMDWPARRGPYYSAAQSVLTRSMQSKNNLQAREEARSAFAAAAREAGILLGLGATASNQLGYHLLGSDGSETFTTNRSLAKALQAKGWMAIGFIALPIVATDVMVSAGEVEYQRLLAGTRNPLPHDGIYKVLKAAFMPLNGA